MRPTPASAARPAPDPMSHGLTPSPPGSPVSIRVGAPAFVAGRRGVALDVGVLPEVGLPLAVGVAVPDAVGVSGVPEAVGTEVP